MKSIEIMAAVCGGADGIRVGGGPCDHALDDGVSEESIGLTGGGVLSWANQLEADPTCTQLRSIQVAFGSVTPNLPARIFVYDDLDNDGDPSDAILIAPPLDIVTANEGLDVFNQYTLPTPTNVTNSFFVVVTIEHDHGEFPAAIDQTASQGRSWLGFGFSNPDDPLGSGGTLGTTDSFGLGGNLLIRAQATPHTACVVDTNADLAIDVTDLVNVILGWGTDGQGVAGVNSDLNLDGTVNVQDMLAVILAWGECPDNDSCEAPLLVGLGETSFSSVDATRDPDAIGFTCEHEPVNDLWFELAPTACTFADATVWIEADYDLVVEYYPQKGCPSEPGYHCQQVPARQPAVVDAFFFGGLIRIGSLGGSGTGTLTYTCGPFGEGCVFFGGGSQRCSWASSTSPPSDHYFSMLVPCYEPAPEAVFCPELAEPFAPSMWFRITGTGNTMTLTLCPEFAFATEEVTVIVMCGECGTATCLASMTGACDGSDPPSITWCSEAGVDYPILVQSGPFEAMSGFTVIDDGIPCGTPDPCDPGTPFTNDDCIDAQMIGTGAHLYQNGYATTDGPAHPTCERGGDGGVTVKDVWFQWAVDVPGGGAATARISTCSEHGGETSYDTDIVVYDPSLAGGPVCDGLEAALVACNDDDLSSPCGGYPWFQSTVEMPVVDGETYLIRVGGWAGAASGVGRLVVELE